LTRIICHILVHAFGLYELVCMSSKYDSFCCALLSDIAVSIVVCRVCSGDNFRVDEETVRRDHSFLEDDALEALFRFVCSCIIYRNHCFEMCFYSKSSQNASHCSWSNEQVLYR